MINQPWIVIQTFIDLNPYKLYYHPFIISMKRCSRSCNIVEHSFGTIFVPNKEDVNLKVFKMIKGTNESKTLSKHILCECKC